jgi:hypothetical protein
MSDKLLHDIESVKPEQLSDLLLVMAKNIEESMIKGGAKPGTDYSMIDLYQLAQPFALEVFKNNINTISYAIRWQSKGGD